MNPMKGEREHTYLLGIETSGLTSAIGISQEGQLLAQLALNVKNVHSRRLALMVEQLWEHVGFPGRNQPLYEKPAPFSAIALSAGPGSFTGLRIGYSLAKGLAHVWEIPIIEVPTLDIWAYQQGETELPVLSVIDAHRGEIFYGLYRWNNQSMQRVGDCRLTGLNTLPGILKEPALVVGGGLRTLREKLEQVCGQRVVIPFPLLVEPQCRALLDLAFQKYGKGDTVSAESCEPRYMRAFKGAM